MKEVTNNQLFEYMTMMYGELKGDITEMKGEQMSFGQTLAVMEVRSEERFKVLFEGYTANTEAIVELKHQVHHLEKVVMQHEVKLKVVK